MLIQKGCYSNWKQVEAVCFTPYNSADRSFAEASKYYGQGILRAMDAIEEYPMSNIDVDKLQKSKPCRSSWLGISEAINLIFKRTRSMDYSVDLFKQSLEPDVQSVLFLGPGGMEFLKEVTLAIYL